MDNNSKMTNSIKILGAYGGKGIEFGNTCLQVNQNTVIDAGNILKALGDNAANIDNIFVSHSHLDHITDIPFLIDIFFEKRDKPIIIYALEETINHLNDFIFNTHIWPNFCEINLMRHNEKAIQFVILEFGKEIELEDGTKIRAIENNHTTSSCGFVISKNGNSSLFTSDTYKCDRIWEEVNNDKKIKSVIIEVSFPSRFDELAKLSKHLTPKLLKKELQLLKRDDVRVFINHIKPCYKEEIVKEVDELDLLLNKGKVLEDDDVISLSNEYQTYTKKTAFTQQKEIDDLIEIGS